MSDTAICPNKFIQPSVVINRQYLVLKPIQHPQVLESLEALGRLRATAIDISLRIHSILRTSTIWAALCDLIRAFVVMES